MRFIFGMIIGGLLTVGGAYVVDRTSGVAEPMVNWSVVAKNLVDERGEVTLQLQAVNQRDETIALGEAVVVLPRRPAPNA